LSRRCLGALSLRSAAGVGHFAADQAPDRVNELLLQHLTINNAAR
jgi:hypothetical protein